MERGAAGEGRSVAEVQLFREDVVQSVAQPSMIGVVSKVGGDSGSEDDSSDDSSDEEEEEVAEGSAKVCWINSNESTMKLGDIRVVDRTFLHGDIVAKVSDPLGQTGTVVNVEMMVDLEPQSGEILKDVSSRSLRRVRAFAIGDYVIRDSWLGRVDDIVDNVMVVFDDGAKCKVLRADPDHLFPYDESMTDESACPYFQGQKVRSTSAWVFKSAKWLKGSWKASRTEGIVVDVEAASVLVYWIATRNTLGISQPSAVPDEEQDAMRLLPLLYFSHTNWQLGDRSLPPALMHPGNVVSMEGSQVDGRPAHGDAERGSENDAGRSAETVDLNCWSGESCKGGGEAWTSHRRKGKQPRRPMKREKKITKGKTVEYAMLIVNTRTRVDILWQDGTVSQGIDACSLISVDHLGDHDFWPEHYVMERGADGEGFDVEPRRVGVVKVVDAKQRTARVRWLKIVQRPEDPREFESEEVVSVYELVEHPDYSYCLGDVVIRLISAPSPSVSSLIFEDSDRAVSSVVVDPSGADPNANETDTSRQKPSKQSAKRKMRKVKPSPQNLSWVGVIIGLQDGDIEVAWADGMVSKVGPQAILVVTRDLDDSSAADTSDLEDAEDVDDAASWETAVSDDDIKRGDQGEPGEAWDCEGAAGIGDQDELGGESPSGASVDYGNGEIATKEHHAQNLGGPFKFPLVALGLVSRFATGLLGLRGGKKDADSAGGDRASSSQGRTHPKQGIVPIHDSDPSSGKETPRSTTKWHMTECDSLCERDSFPIFNNPVLKSLDPEEQDNELTSSNAPTDADSEDKELSPCVDSPNSVDDGDKQHHADVYGFLKGSLDGDNLTETERKTSAIKHFDCVKDPSDHRYVGQPWQPINRRKWAKKIQQEWSILKENLPDTIYVQVYEDRMDLMRAVIVGAAGTPYHDGLFIFDLYMPPEYPSVPPVAHYHSGGLRLNPNLYENGEVCLSLLNTWTGKGSEIWHPSTSSILQVLVSIQGLVLNEKPYFNEAGYGKQVGTEEGEKNSLVYNENAFLLSCKSMLYLLRRPPRHFEDLIRDHFRKHGHYVLLACRAYLAGAVVGSLKDLSDVGERKFDDQSSAGFKLMLNKLIPKLSAAFEEVLELLKPAFLPAVRGCNVMTLSAQDMDQISEQQSAVRQLESVLTFHKYARATCYGDALKELSKMSFLPLDSRTPERSADVFRTTQLSVQACIPDRKLLSHIWTVLQTDGSVHVLKTKISNFVANSLPRNLPQDLYERVARML